MFPKLVSKISPSKQLSLSKVMFTCAGWFLNLLVRFEPIDNLSATKTSIYCINILSTYRNWKFNVYLSYCKLCQKNTTDMFLKVLDNEKNLRLRQTKLADPFYFLVYCKNIIFEYLILKNCSSVSFF